MKQPLTGFFSEFRAAFESARKQADGDLDVWIEAGGRKFLIRFATTEMRDMLMPALKHLTIPPGNAGDRHFTIEAWDSAATGVWPPNPPWTWDAGMRKGEISNLDDPRFEGHANSESGVVSLHDIETRAAIFWMRDARSLRGYEKAAPFLQIFQWCFQQAGRRITHSAVIGDASGAALLAGRGGSGKSTTAALARESGLLHLGDDYCLLADAPPRAFTFYSTAKLHPRSLQLAPLAAWGGETAWLSDEKNVVLLEDAPSERPLKMILLPRVKGTGLTAARRASAAEALRALAPSSLFQLPGTMRTAFTFFSSLVKQLPAYHLDLGTDAENVGTRLRELLEGATP